MSEITEFNPENCDTEISNTVENGLCKKHYMFGRLDKMRLHKGWTEKTDTDFTEWVNNSWGISQLGATKISKNPSLVYVMVGRVGLTKYYPDLITEPLCVIGYVIMYLKNTAYDGDTPPDNRVRFIDLMDTRIRGYNIGEYMIKRIETLMRGKMLLPYVIANSSIEYWILYFNRHFNIVSEDDLIAFDKMYTLNDTYSGSLQSLIRLKNENSEYENMKLASDNLCGQCGEIREDDRRCYECDPIVELKNEFDNEWDKLDYEKFNLLNIASKTVVFEFNNQLKLMSELNKTERICVLKQNIYFHERDIKPTTTDKIYNETDNKMFLQLYENELLY